MATEYDRLGAVSAVSRWRTANAEWDAIFCWFQFSKLAHKSCAKKCIGMVGTVDADLGEFTPGRPNEEAKWEMESSFDIGEQLPTTKA